MNKNLIIGAVVLLVLGGAGWYLLKGKTSTSSQTGTPQSATSNAITSIKDALSKSVTLQCDYKDEQGRESKSYIKNGAVRVDVISSDPAKSASIIMKDKKFYSWNGKSGMMMVLPDEVMDKAKEAANQGVSQQATLMASMEKYKDACKPGVVSDSLFTPPTDVKFVDYSQMMKGSAGQQYMHPTAGSGY